MLPSKEMQLTQECINLSFSVELVVVVRAQISKHLTVFQQVVDSDEHGMSNSNNGTLLAAFIQNWNGGWYYDELSISGYRQRIYEYVYTRYKDVA